jgi:hypothetical protein
MDCNLHNRTDCTLCDECDHEANAHVNAHDQAAPLSDFIFANATCWAENICLACNPTMKPR